MVEVEGLEPKVASGGQVELVGDIFPTEQPLKLCSWNQCTRGHQWMPVMALAKCPGCGAQALMVKMQNCPFCNEPATKMSLRSDYLASAAGVPQRCKGQTPIGESMDVEFVRHGWQEIEQGGEKDGKTTSEGS